MPSFDLSPAHWTHLITALEPNRVFARSLGPTEAAFYWDGEFAGTSDVAERTTIVLAPSLHLDSAEADSRRFRAIWVQLKRRFPLLAARVDELDGGDALRFVVEETRTRTVSEDYPDEFEYVAEADSDDVQRVLDRALNAPVRRICPRRGMAVISVLRRIDAPLGTYDVVTLASHAIADGMASATLTRTLCEVLARWPVSLDDPIPDLEGRLRMVPTVDSLHPRLSLSLARRRWRYAAARIIQARRVAAMKCGHTLPGHRVPTTPRTPAHTTTLRVHLSPPQTNCVVSAARAHAVSVAHILPALAHTALARILHRRKQKWRIGEEEWERRQVDVVHLGGPINVRPFLDPEWVEKGGAYEVNLSISFWAAQFPHVAPPLSQSDGAKNDIPPLSPARFWRLATRAKTAMLTHYRHPLFFDIVESALPVRAVRGRTAAETYRRIQNGEDVPLPLADPKAIVFGSILSSMGNMDRLAPSEFAGADGTTAIKRTAADLFLRCRPGELYLGMKTVGGVMEFYVYYDANVFDDDDAKEWLEAVREAAVYYCSHESQ
ncbi:hypothetical protein K488DRAFT_88814 [Vararia minispora EC-137]|uniref:Uncharacterized protein n=1 Tax=Vararia minispora EC-137 TaxID=1314806 RepID=A0ACB8QC97_9AGAM|nr:hypothetical protein K488DRAFT_88814 [Vararia minispora EC-137]